MPTQDYLNLVPQYNATAPKFMATLSAVLAPLVALQGTLEGMPAAFDLDTAVGVQLDQVGLWIGRNRYVAVPVQNVYFSWDTDNLGWEQGFWQGEFDPGTGIQALDDTTYRDFLYAKAILNGADGTIYTLSKAINTLLRNEGVTAQIIDNFNMTMTVTIVGTLNSQLMIAVLSGGYLPIQPEGVSVTYNNL